MRYSWLLVFIVFSFCHEQNKNKISPAELVKSREIKKVSEAEILREGTVFGNQIMSELNALLELKLDSLNPDCQINEWGGLDELKKKYEINIQLASSLSENLEPLEYQLIEAYQYSLDNRMEMSAAVQKLDDRYVIYTMPIQRQLIQICPEQFSDQAITMWSVRIPIKGIINRL